MFKKGDYIVCLITTPGSDCVRENFCFKQRQDMGDISPYVDIKGSNKNGNSTLKFQNSRDWRYATQSEIDVYNSYNIPFDTSQITNPKSPTYEIY